MSTNGIEITGLTEYLTDEHDTFDLIAWLKYDDEFLASLIIEHNPDYADVIVFDAGTTLMLPEINIIEAETSVPPWRRSDDS